MDLTRDFFNTKNKGDKTQAMVGVEEITRAKIKSAQDTFTEALNELRPLKKRAFLKEIGAATIDGPIAGVPGTGKATSSTKRPLRRNEKKGRFAAVVPKK